MISTLSDNSFQAVEVGGSGDCFSALFAATIMLLKKKKQKNTMLKYVNYVSLKRVNFESLFFATELLPRCFSLVLGVNNPSEAIA